MPPRLPRRPIPIPITIPFPRTNHAHHQHQHQHAPFTTTPARPNPKTQTHYDTLNIPITATTQEIKKQFYSLSLQHHPDRNKGDPSSTSRFARISSAYQVLGNESKRRVYDYEHGLLRPSHHPASNASQASQAGSHSSYSSGYKGGTTYAGSRPASGLSQRRGPFRGPPPSFYQQGGYGRSGRTASAAGGGGGAGARTGTRSGSDSGAGSSGSGAAGGAGSGDDEDPTAFIDRNTVYHFNARGHFRTQSAEDARRQNRRYKEMGADVHEKSGNTFIWRFLAVCGILFGANALTGAFQSSPDVNMKSSKKRSNA